LQQTPKTKGHARVFKFLILFKKLIFSRQEREDESLYENSEKKIRNRIFTPPGKEATAARSSRARKGNILASRF